MLSYSKQAFSVEVRNRLVARSIDLRPGVSEGCLHPAPGDGAWQIRVGNRARDLTTVQYEYCMVMENGRAVASSRTESESIRERQKDASATVTSSG